MKQWIVSCPEGAMQWYRNDGGQAAGPMTYDELRALAVAGTLGPADQVWSPGFPSWVTATDIPGLIPKRALAAAPPRPPAQVAEPPATRVPVDVAEDLAPARAPERVTEAMAAPPAPARVADAVTQPPTSPGSHVAKREAAGPRLAHAGVAWPPPPPAPGSPMPPSRKLASAVDSATVAAAARARLVTPATPRPAPWPSSPPSRPHPPPPTDAAQHDHA